MTLGGRNPPARILWECVTQEERKNGVQVRERQKTSPVKKINRGDLPSIKPQSQLGDQGEE